MPMGRGIEVLWFDRRAVSVGDKCQAGFLTSELPSLLHTDTDNAHTDNATKSHLTAEIAAGRPEKRGARARYVHDMHTRAGASSTARGELPVDMRMPARGA